MRHKLIGMKHILVMMVAVVLVGCSLPETEYIPRSVTVETPHNHLDFLQKASREELVRLMSEGDDNAAWILGDRVQIPASNERAEEFYFLRYQWQHLSILTYYSYDASGNQRKWKWIGSQNLAEQTKSRITTPAKQLEFNRWRNRMSEILKTSQLTEWDDFIKILIDQNLLPKG